jgi:1,4-alpha-glucan branching enzyme
MTSPVHDPSADPSSSATGPKPVSDEEIDRLVGGAHFNPHSILGAHAYQGKVTVRALRPLAESVEIVTRAGSVAMTHERAGVFVAVLDRETPPAYRLDVRYAGGEPIRQDDPYRFLPTLGEIDLHLLAKAGTSGCGRSSARTRGATPPTTWAGSPAPGSRSGPPTPAGSG